LAYSEGSALIGPEGDPDGWKVLPSIHANGTLFDTKAVDVEFSVSCEFDHDRFCGADSGRLARTRESCKFRSTNINWQ
jgi:hypothetical protein